MIYSFHVLGAEGPGYVGDAVESSFESIFLFDHLHPLKNILPIVFHLVLELSLEAGATSTYQVNTFLLDPYPLHV